jgi:Tfp pilus assembly protein PilX
MKRTKSIIPNNQQGMVAIIVTMIIMMILSLIVLGFAQLTRREQRQSFDRQLGTQAFYAAETGINDVRNVLSNTPVAEAPSHTTDCTAFINDAGLVARSQLRGADVTYSCLLVDQSPTVLEYDNINQNSSVVVPIREKNNAVIDRITIGWEDAEGGLDTSGCPAFRVFPSLWTDCDTGILKVEFVPFNGAASRSALTDSRFIGFMQPNYSGGTNSVSYASGSGSNNQGNIFSINCTNGAGGKDCSVQLTGLNITRGYLRLQALYRPASVSICSPDCSAGVELADAQAQVDVTGKAIDVLRRVQVRIPTGIGAGDYPEFALQTLNTLCKRIATAPPNTVNLLPPASGFIGSEGTDCRPN